MSGVGGVSRVACNVDVGAGTAVGNGSIAGPADRETRLLRSDDHGANMIRRCLVLAALVASLVMSTLALARQSATAASPAQQTAKPASPADDPSGMYSFLREGEIVQFAVQDGKVSGFISRFGNADSDKGQFLDQFFDKASLAGDRSEEHTSELQSLRHIVCRL